MLLALVKGGSESAINKVQKLSPLLLVCWVSLLLLVSEVKMGGGGGLKMY